MLLLLQAVAQQLPPINVTVQSPPGMPFWKTALISAVVGTFFGLASSIGMEFVKPWIAKAISRKEIEKQLALELADNLQLLDELILWVNSHCVPLGSKDNWIAPLETIGMTLEGTGRDRYDYYLATQKALLYEIDDTQMLGRFYRNLHAISLWKPPDKPLGFVQLIEHTCKIGHEYLAFKGIAFTPKIVQMIENHQRVLKDAESAESENEI
jgi:hypothetical protein